ncbi:MAG: dockerin type I domain-containing protein, partial [Sedimentisphaerales bacterium]|nr:dockerin type I domain-containing protein [Sedimentisphaerales bacterium]
MRIALASFVLMASLVGSVTASCPLGDVNKDCQVDLQDLSLLAEQWLAPPDSSVDLNGDDSINMVDLALLAESWHEAGIAIVINEVLASNATTTKDPQGQYDDWIELYN